MTNLIDGLVERAIAARLTPGAVVLIGRGDDLLHLQAYGTTMYGDAGSRPVRFSDIYDLASITKIFTATLALQLIERGTITLDTPACAILPRLRARTVTLRHLLTHSSGLDLRLSLLRDQGRAGILDAVFALEPAHPPGSRVAYTNLNSLLLGLIIEQLSGQSLAALLAQELTGPLGMADTRFCPPPALAARIVPTEVCAWRGGLVHGQVHDESAYALGGIAGHAGIFASARDLWQLGRMWLQGGTLHGRRYLSQATVALATRDQTPQAAEGQHCGLGWMVERPLFMGHQHQGTYGHTGFTGPTLLVHPQRQLVIVLLCNRVYPQRQPQRSHALVAAIANLFN